MSDEPKKDNGSEWSMPEPIFRSSEGRTPKTAKNYTNTDDIDTLAPDFFEADTDEIYPEPDREAIVTEAPETERTTYEESPPKNIVRPAAPKKAGGCVKTFGFVAGIVVVAVIAVVVAIVYFLYSYRTPDSTF